MKTCPLYTQHDAMDCGPTCLRMVAAFYGKRYSLQYLRENCFISRQGVSMLGISEAAEKLGMHTIGLRIPISKLIDDIPLPCIIHWNQNHFVVLYRIEKSKKGYLFHVADPVGSKIIYTEDKFKRYWLSGRNDGEDEGIALCLEPTPDFYNNADEEDKESKGKRSIMFLFLYLRPYKRLILQLFIGLGTGSLIQLILPFLTQSIVDFGITNQNLDYIYLVLIAQIVLVISSTSVEFIRGWILLHIGMRVNISLISDYLAKLMRLPIAYFDTKMTGDILQRVNDHTRIQEFLTSTSLSTLFSIVNIAIFGLVILFYNWVIFSIFFLGSALYVAWVWLFMKQRAMLDHKMFTQNSANQSNMVQLVNGMQEIKLNACEQQKRWEWEYIQARKYRITVKGLALAQYQQSGGVLINQMKNAIITALVAALVIQGNITLGMMLSIQYIIGQLNSPIDQLIGFVRQYQDAKLSIDRLQEVYTKDDEYPADKPLITDIHNADIRIEHLTFRYDKLNEKPTLDDIDLTIPKGKTTAIVGLSGSGKTTLLKLILGFYQPDKGKVVLGNSDIENYDKREWRKHCGTVMQDGFIFSDTIARNIAPGEERIDEDRMCEAADTANIRNFIEKLPLGYNTKIGAEGHGLSMGQRQRILISRAIYKNPEYIFMDEATNSLDTNNEYLIMEKLNQFMQGKTAIVIAHRLSTVRNADNIVVLQSGRICEEGTHDELISRHGVYYTLVKNQLNV
ncbi:MAG: peptidase domain-containing ABC transporter [Prevotella sp.]|nr:peptidase domain-containing ABC transporter [Prevotella sp.]